MSDTPFKMKYTDGKKANPSAFPFMISALGQGVGSIAKRNWKKLMGKKSPKETMSDGSSVYKAPTASTASTDSNDELITLLQEEDTKKEEVQQAIDTRDTGGKETLA